MASSEVFTVPGPLFRAAPLLFPNITVEDQQEMTDDQPKGKCGSCGRILLAPLPWCPGCGTRIRPAKDHAADANADAWVQVMACQKPVGAVVVALLKEEGIPCRSVGGSGMGAAEAMLFPVISVRPDDAERARLILKSAGLLEV